MVSSNPTHLCKNQIINQGSFYTPKKYVNLASQWLQELGVNSSYTFLDSSCGYGAFFQLKHAFGKNKFIGNDIDSTAVNNASMLYPGIHFYNKNALYKVDRSEFGITTTEPLIVIGNPPYNDTTSQINRKIKDKKKIDIDQDIKSRDLGLSSLNSYNKLKAEYACILHPLSYLTKEANYKSAKSFFSNYRILKSIIFPSSEFANTSKHVCFPVIMALYERNVGNGTEYSGINGMVFNTVEGVSFSVGQWDYLGDYIQKYPTSIRYSKEILFYTLRDINALKRSRTFIKERLANAVDVNPDKLNYYCYVDCFKRYANPPYYMGNFDIPFIQKDFDGISDAVVRVSKYNHPEIFGITDIPSDVDVKSVIKYIHTVTNLTA